MKYTDKELLDFLEAEGMGIAVIHDDDGHWCVASDGMQECVEGPENFSTSYMVPGRKFGRKKLREAIEAFVDDYKNHDGENYENAVNEAYVERNAAAPKG